MITILIADDHTIVREGLKQILEEEDDMLVAYEADNGNDAVTLALQNNIDVILLDISMPDKDGLEVLKILQRQKPEISVLILTMHPEEQYAIRVMRLGAGGYLTKKSASSELTYAIRLLASGKKYITPALSEKLLDVLEHPVKKNHYESLSDREFQVFRFIASGLKIKDIAQKLYLSPKTISTYQTRIFTKLHLTSSTELVHYALKHNLLN